MDGNHPTMGDLAYNAARSAEVENRQLRKRIEDLEAEVKTLRSEVEEWADEVTKVVNRILVELNL